MVDISSLPDVLHVILQELMLGPGGNCIATITVSLSHLLTKYTFH